MVRQATWLCAILIVTQSGACLPTAVCLTWNLMVSARWALFTLMSETLTSLLTPLLQKVQGIVMTGALKLIAA